MRHMHENVSHRDESRALVSTFANLTHLPILSDSDFGFQSMEEQSTCHHPAAGKKPYKMDQQSPPVPPNIYIIGAQSTGKTTLVSALAAYFASTNESFPQPRILSEVARSVMRHHNLIAQDITSSPASALKVQSLILEAQVEAETALRGHWYISDRSALDPLVYADVYVGKDGREALTQTPSWRTAKGWMKDGVVVVCEAGGEWLIDDGVRLMPDDRVAWCEMHTRFCSTLNDLGISHTVLPSSISQLETRVHFVVQEWKNKWTKESLSAK